MLLYEESCIKLVQRMRDMKGRDRPKAPHEVRTPHIIQLNESTIRNFPGGTKDEEGQVIARE